MFLRQKPYPLNEQQLRAILDNTADGIVVIDSIGQILSFNKACETLFDYSSNEVLGQNIRVLLPEICEAKMNCQDREANGARKDGTIFPMLISFANINQDNTHLLVGILRDATVKKEAERQSLLYTQTLEQNNRDLNDFIYIISHDLKEPIRGMYNYAQFMIEDYSDKLEDDGKAKLNGLMKMAIRMSDLIDKLLYYSRLNKSQLTCEKINISTIYYKVIDMLRPYMEQHKAMAILENSLPDCICDPLRIEEVLHQLITNGITYNDQIEKFIHVGVTQNHKGYIGQNVFYVRDNGIGIPEKHFESIFKMFKRLHPRDAYGGGAGAGLAISKTIITQHGGHIWLDSTPNEGTTFYFTIEKNGEQEHMGRSYPVANGRKNHYVLIIEDSQDDFEIISRAFQRVEFSPDIHHSIDGDEALAFLNHAAEEKKLHALPALILLDLNLPGTDGRQVLTKMKLDHILKKIPVIILSTSNNESDIEFCFASGADRYLKKPISLDEFSDTARIIKRFWEDQIMSHTAAYHH